MSAAAHWKHQRASSYDSNFEREKHDEPVAAFCRECLERRKVDDDAQALCDACAALRLGDDGESDTTVSTYVSTFDQSAMERMQLLSTFLSEHYPSAVEPEVYLARHTSLFMNLPLVDISSPMMAGAVDTLCLAHLGTNHKDQRLLFASRNAYGRVLSNIMQAVSGKAGKKQYSPRDVIASCLLMSVYNDGSPGEDPARNYATHLFGAAQYAQVCGPNCLDPTKPFDQKILMWVRFQSLFVCVAKRKRFFWDERRWREREDLFPPGGSRDWFPLLVPLPGLLERSDMFLKKYAMTPTRQQQVFKVCVELDSYRESLLAWVETDFAGRPGIAAITDPENFDFEIEEHCFITTSSTFPIFHVFVNPAHAMRCISSWILALVSDCTLLRLIRTYPTMAKHLRRSFREIEQKAYFTAADICKSVYYYSVLNSMAYAHMLYVFIDLAKTFFEEYGGQKEVGWCQACLIATKLRIERPGKDENGKARTARKKTLCRVGDLLGGFERACRYRSGPVIRPLEFELLEGPKGG